MGVFLGSWGIMGPKTLQELISVDFWLILGGFWEVLAPQEPHKILFLEPPGAPTKGLEVHMYI